MAETVEHRRSYVLEFLTSGEYKIPPMTISFRDRRPGAGGAPPEPAEGGVGAGAGTSDAASATPEAEYKIITDEIALQVKPLANPESLKELAPIAPQAEPPPLPAEVKWPLAIAGGILGLGAAGYALTRYLRRPAAPPPPTPAHERAYRDLEWLLAQGFIDRGELKEFFFHLSRILREYIENRFGLRAPERTTEEFLGELSHEAGRAAPIPREHQRLLSEFLERSDLVKFAKYTPAKDEIESSFESAKRFIESTRLLAEPRAAA